LRRPELAPGIVSDVKRFGLFKPPEEMTYIRLKSFVRYLLLAQISFISESAIFKCEKFPTNRRQQITAVLFNRDINYVNPVSSLIIEL
jgi:hypothetical protein